MNSSTVGVALITYNGLKYLPEQLDSILNQTRKVDHIVVSDDCSADGTWEFLEAWAGSCPVPVTLIRNEKQLGVRGNIEQAMKAVKADVIFTADQDDLWVADKVEILAGVFDARPDVLLVHTDADLVDGEGRPLGQTLFGGLGVTRRERAAMQAGKAIEVYARRNIVTGATMAFRASLLELAQPFPDTWWYHDYWLAWMAASIGRVELVDRPLIKYRQHGANVVGVGQRQGRLAQLRQLYWDIAGPNSWPKTLVTFESRRLTLQAHLSSRPGVGAESLAMATEALEFMRRRKALPRNRAVRTAAVLKHALSGRYGRFSTSPWSEALRDVLNR